MNLFFRFTYKQILIISGIFSAVTFITLGYFDIPLKTDAAPNGIISFEFAKGIEQSIAIISSWDMTAKIYAGLSLGIDFLFLVIYGVFFATACYLIAQKYINKNNRLYKLGIFISMLQFVAALFDAIENIALIKLLLGSNNSIFPLVAFYFAAVKFAIIGIGILYIIGGLIISLVQKK